MEWDSYGLDDQMPGHSKAFGRGTLGVGCARDDLAVLLSINR
jgi:hypothetical protein